MADPLFRRADRLLLLSETQRDIYLRAGIPLEKTRIAPNFLARDLDPGPPPDTSRAGYLFVGRLSEEKGIRRLLQRWPDGQDLTIVGTGPQLEEIEAFASTRPQVTVAGGLSRSAVIDAMRRHKYLLFPSLCLEGFPMVYPEALASGLAIMAFVPSALAELAEREGTGFSVRWSDRWEDLVIAASDVEDFSPSNCRDIFEERYSESAFLMRTEDLIGAVCG
jgi:glycosyltransferase involved in cell wall biosynthesis